MRQGLRLRVSVCFCHVLPQSVGILTVKSYFDAFPNSFDATPLQDKIDVYAMALIMYYILTGADLEL